MSRRGVFGILVGGMAASLGGCGSRDSARYKVIVEVDTPVGPRSGFAVREVRYPSGGNWFPFGESRGQAKLNGEAVAIDLPNDMVLFALLRSDTDVDHANAIPMSLLSTSDGKPINGPVLLWPEGGQHRSLRKMSAPMLVSFRDVSDPTTVIRVAPDDPAATLGPGFAIRKIAVQRTEEPITKSIESRLSWWHLYENRQLDGSRYNNSNSMANIINRRDFAQGLSNLGRDSSAAGRGYAKRLAA